MKRNITKKLIAWKGNPQRKPLILRGARQTGKSYSITEFGKNHFAGEIHIINLEKQPEWHNIFEKNLDSKRILSEIEWSRQAKSSNAETDFLIEQQNKIIPIEVKSGAAGSLKSLHILFDTYKNIENAYVFSEAHYGEIPEQKLRFFPLYYVCSVTGKG